MNDLISRRQAVEKLRNNLPYMQAFGVGRSVDLINELPSAEPTIVRCYECKHNPKSEWFGCPMANLSEQQRPEDAWCWKGERREQ